MRSEGLVVLVSWGWSDWAFQGFGGVKDGIAGTLRLWSQLFGMVRDCPGLAVSVFCAGAGGA